MPQLEKIINDYLEDIGEYYNDWHSKGHVGKIDPYVAFTTVRDNWINQNKLKELISFIHLNWRSTDSSRFTDPLETYLIKTKQIDLFKFFWKTIITERITNLFTSVHELNKQANRISAYEISILDLSNFYISSKDANKDLTKLVGFHRQLTLIGLVRMKNGLIQAQEINEAATIQLIIDDIEQLNAPSLECIDYLSNKDQATIFAS
jgi:hypothetical protein